MRDYIKANMPANSKNNENLISYRFLLEVSLVVLSIIKELSKH